MKIKIKKTKHDFRVNKDEMKKLLSLLGDNHKICQFFRFYIKNLEKDMPESNTILLSKNEITEFTKLYKERKLC